MKDALRGRTAGGMTPPDFTPLPGNDLIADARSPEPSMAMIERLTWIVCVLGAVVFGFLMGRVTA